jgi:YihY family inner membrane protein
MNPIERGLRRLDRAQQRHTAPAFAVGVAKKYGDDNGGILASSLAHSAFVSVFPLLLILLTILGIVASGNPAVYHDVHQAVDKQFPVIGPQLMGHHGVQALSRSSMIGLAAGLLGLLWGATGLAQSGLFTMAQVWNLPGPARPGYVPRLGRCLLFIGVLGTGVIVTTGLSAVGTFGQHLLVFVLLAEILAAVANSGLFFIGFRVLTPKGVPSRNLIAGAIVGGVAWTVLQAIGVAVVHHFLHSGSVYGVFFGTVLGLVAWLYLAVQVTVYAAEINVVLARHLWPRSIIQPPLTEADRSSMALQALQNQRREEQNVTVSFNDRPHRARADPQAPRTPAQISPPADPAGPPAHGS